MFAVNCLPDKSVWQMMPRFVSLGLFGNSMTLNQSYGACRVLLQPLQGYLDWLPGYCSDHAAKDMN